MLWMLFLLNKVKDMACQGWNTSQKKIYKKILMEAFFGMSDRNKLVLVTSFLDKNYEMYMKRFTITSNSNQEKEKESLNC